MIVRHARGSGDVLQTRLLASGSLALNPPGLLIEAAGFFT
jgi:hypothetical protein